MGLCWCGGHHKATRGATSDKSNGYYFSEP